jgi:hypothetical protein
LPRAYIRRFTEELADHCEDLFQENHGMDALIERLGSPQQLAEQAASQTRQRYYAGRHPLVTFVAGPIPVAVLTLVAICLVFQFAISVLPEASGVDGGLHRWEGVFLQCVAGGIRYLPSLAGAMVFCLIAQRACCPCQWSLVACLLLALLGSLIAVNLTLPVNGPGSGSLMIGLGVPPQFGNWPQALLPLGVWAAFFGSALRRRSAVVAG